MPGSTYINTIPRKDNIYATIATLLRITIACLFILSGVMKGVNLQAVAQTVRDYCGLFGMTPHPLMISAAAFGVCVLEIWIGYLALDCRIYRRFWPVYILVISGFSFLTYVNLTSPLGNLESCGCFGEIIHVNATQTFVKNILMLSMTAMLSAMILKSPKTDENEIPASPFRVFLICAIAAILPIAFSAIFISRIKADTYLTLYYIISAFSLILVSISKKITFTPNKSKECGYSFSRDNSQ